MPIQIRTRGFENNTARQASIEILKSIIDSAPRWINIVVLERKQDNSTESPDDRAQITCMPEYKEARIDLFPKWFDLNETEQQEVLAHELCHGFSAELCEFIENELFPFVKKSNAALCEHLTRDYRSLLESMTEETTIALLRGVEHK
jgi:hypothetical protein